MTNSSLGTCMLRVPLCRRAALLRACNRPSPFPTALPLFVHLVCVPQSRPTSSGAVSRSCRLGQGRRCCTEVCVQVTFTSSSQSPARALGCAQANMSPTSLKTAQNEACSASFSLGLLHAATFATCDQSYIFDWSHINKKDWLAQSICLHFTVLLLKLSWIEVWKKQLVKALMLTQLCQQKKIFVWITNFLLRDAFLSCS